MLPQLEGLIKSKIRTELADRVVFTAQTEAFFELGVHASTVLVCGVCERAGPALTTMRKTNWGSVHAVGDDSPYVGQIKAVLEESVVRVRAVLSATNFKSYCLKLATELISRFQDGVTRQKKITQAGAEQLLLDVNSLKSYLLKLHHVGFGSGDNKLQIPPSFTSLVTAKIKQLEIILKLVCTEDEILEQRFAIMWPEGTPEDMNMILSMKGRGPGLMAPLANVGQSVRSAVDKVRMILRSYFQ